MTGKQRNILEIILLLAIMALGGVLGYGWHLYQGLVSDKETLILENTGLQEKIEVLESDKALLAQELMEQKAIVDAFDDQIRDISDTVGVLDKLSKTDEELLQKYSKVYFLNEHYVPSSLTLIDQEYLYDTNRPAQIHDDVWPFLEDLLEDAERDGIDLQILSAYRSFGTQSGLKSSYKVTYGEGANTFSADQGYSEHQLGTTVDFTVPDLNGGLSGFQNTEAYKWLVDNAHRHGFTLSYPEGNQYYVFEPWHWRFVGEELARDLHRDGKHFYDLSQRELDEYLISIFD